MFAARFKLIGARVKYFRTLRNMTQLELADAAALSEDYISQIERGRATGITIATGLRIAQVLGVDFENLTKDAKNDPDGLSK